MLCDKKRKGDGNIPPLVLYKRRYYFFRKSMQNFNASLPGSPFA
jgi:hypothetical protein